MCLQKPSAAVYRYTQLGIPRYPKRPRPRHQPNGHHLQRSNKDQHPQSPKTSIQTCVYIYTHIHNIQTSMHVYALKLIISYSILFKKGFVSIRVRRQINKQLTILSGSEFGTRYAKESITFIMMDKKWHTVGSTKVSQNTQEQNL